MLLDLYDNTEKKPHLSLFIYQTERYLYVMAVNNKSKNVLKGLV